VLARLAALVEDATVAFDGYDYARALERTESFFWSFCDHYLELVKGRAYGSFGDERAASARAALEIALGAQLRLFAPFLPFVTEEVWSWWRQGSVHRQVWPTVDEVEPATAGAHPGVYEAAAAVLGDVRKAKTEAKRSLKTPVSRVEVVADAARIAALEAAADDMREAGNVTELVLTVGDEPAVRVELAPADQA